MTLAIEIGLSGDRVAAAGLDGMGNGMVELAPVFRDFGVYMAQSSIPLNFRAKGRPETWAPARRWGELTPDPLFDEGSLLRSIDYAVDPFALTLGSRLQKAAYLQFGTAGLPGGVLRPKNAKFLALPNVGANGLTKSQARTMRPRDYPGAFVLMDGPRGPGLYRKASSFSKGSGWARTVDLLWAFVTEVINPARPFVLYQDEDLGVFVEFLMRYLDRRGSV